MKKGISPVVATALLLVVAVVAVVGFNTWFNQYQSKTLSGVEQSSQNSNSLEIDNLIGSTLYIKNPTTSNLSLNTVKIGGKSCTINQNFGKGSFAVNVSACMNNTVGVVDVVIISNASVKSKKIYLKSAVAGTVIIPPVTCSSGTPQGFNGGSGTVADPWQVCNCTQLQKINLYIGGNYSLIKDFSCKGVTFKSLGNDTIPYMTSFNGNYHIIYNLKNPVSTNVGLFGNLGSTAIVQNLGLVNYSSSLGSSYVGSFAAKSSGVLKRVFVTGSITGTPIYAGAIVGSNLGGKINDSFTNVSMIVTNDGDYSGVTGIYPSYVNRVLSVGLLRPTGVVSGEVGGLSHVGPSGGGSCNSCYFDALTMNISFSGMGYPRITSQLKYQASYPTWDFVNTWQINNGNTYPYLKGFNWTPNSAPISSYVPTFLGSGTIGSPYQISTMAQLIEMRYQPTQPKLYFVLTSDIDGSATQTWKYYWRNHYNQDAFNHSLDGQGHTLKNFYILGGSSGIGYNYMGFFSKIDKGAIIKNLILSNITVLDNHNYQWFGVLAGQSLGTIINVTVKNSNITSANGGYIGGLIGSSGNVIISNCTVSNIKIGIGSGSAVGGLIGITSSNFPIYHSSASGTIFTTGGSMFGGLVGMSSTSINASWSSVKIIGGSSIGGLVGNDNCYSIYDSYANGTISGSNNVGGLVGLMGACVGTITRSYSSGSVTGSTNVGGLVGSKTAGSITNSYWDTQTSGQASGCGSGNCTGAVSETTAQMKTQATFSGWNFINTWTITGGVTYPLLR